MCIIGYVIWLSGAHFLYPWDLYNLARQKSQFGSLWFSFFFLDPPVLYNGRFNLSHIWGGRSNPTLIGVLLYFDSRTHPCQNIPKSSRLPESYKFRLGFLSGFFLGFFKQTQTEPGWHLLKPSKRNCTAFSVKLTLFFIPVDSAVILQFPLTKQKRKLDSKDKPCTTDFRIYNGPLLFIYLKPLTENKSYCWNCLNSVAMYLW